MAETTPETPATGTTPNSISALVGEPNGSQATQVPVTNPTTGTTDTGWFDTLPSGLQQEKSLASFKGKSIAAVAESFVNAQKSMGSRLPVPLPTDAPAVQAEKIARLQEALGRPASPDAYKINLPAYAEMGVPHDPELLSSFTSLAHKAGLTNDQVQTIVEWQAGQLAAQVQDPQKAIGECLTALEKGDEQTPGWGATTKRYLAVAKRAADAYFPPAVQTALEDAGFYNDPNFIRGLSKMGRALIEDNVLVGEEINTGSGGQTAQQELDAIMGDSKGAYFDARHPKHDDIVQRALDLRRFLMGQSQG
jgi:hypothetical protein